MWKTHAVSISYLLGKKFLLLIFQTLFTENCPFFDNFDQNLFLHESRNDFDKNGPKVNPELIFD